MKKGLLPVIILAVAVCLLAALMPSLGLDYTWDEILGGIDTTQIDYSLYSENFEKIIGKGEEVDISTLSIARSANNETELIPVTEDMIVYMDSSDSIGYKKVVVKYLEEEYTLHFEVRYRATLSIDGKVVDSQLVKDISDISLPSASDTVRENWDILLPDDITDNFHIDSPSESLIAPLYKISATYGDMLSDLKLPSNEHGSWVLNDLSGTVGDAGYREFDATFIWNDTSREEKPGVIGLDVKKLTVGFTDTVTSFIYDGGAHFPTYKTADGLKVTEIGNDGICDAGTYSFMLIIEDENHEGELSGSFTIEKAPVTVTVKDASLVYGSTASFVPEYTVSGFDNSDILGISVILPKEFNAGSYSLGAEATNENVTLTVTPGTLTVTKAEFDPGEPTVLSRTATFEDKLSSITFGYHPGGIWTWKAPDSDVGSVGEKSFGAKFTPNNPNYFEYETEITIKVEKKTLYFDIEKITFVYNSDPQALKYIIKDINGKTYNDLFVLGNDPKTNAGVYDLELEINDSSYTGSVSVKMVIAKADPDADFSFITRDTWRKGMKLSEIVLPSGYKWADPDAVINGAGAFSFGAIYTPTDTANYETEIGILSIDLDKASSSIGGVLDSYVFTYDKTEHTIEGIVSSHDESSPVLSILKNGSSASAIFGAGSYTVTVTLPETSNYKAASVTTSVTVLKADNTDTVSTNQSATYGDSISVITLPKGEEGVWTIKESSATVGAAGTRTFTALFTPTTENYNPREVTITLGVAKKTVTVPSIASKVYNDSNILSGLTDTDLYTVTLDEGGKNVGTYPVALTLRDSANYKWQSTDSASVTLSFEIIKAENSWQSAPSVSGGVYGDGVSFTAEALFGEFEVYFREASGDDADYSLIAPTNAGSYVAKFVSTSTNAYIITKEVNFTIQKRGVDLPSVSDKTYTGETLYSGLSGGDIYSVYDEGGKNVNASGYNVTVTLSDPTNYKWNDGADGTVRTLTYFIIKASVTLKEDLAIDSWTFGEGASVPTATKDSILGTIEYLYSSDGINYSKTVPTAAGTYYLKASVSGTANYNGDESEPITFTIAKAQPSVLNVEESYSSVFVKGGAFDYTAIGTPSYTGGTLTYSVTKNGETVSAITGAGTYIVTVTLTESENYLSSTSVTTVVISPADNTDTVMTAQSATYGDSISVITLPVSEDGTWTIKESSATVGAAGTRTYTALFTPATENYNLREVTITVTVAKKTVTVPIVSNKTYTGTNLNSGLTDTELYTVTLDEGGIAEGNYSVTVTLTDPDNYAWQGSVDESVTLGYVIAKAVNNWTTAPSIDSWTYGDEANEGYAEVEHGDVLIEYREDREGAEFSTSVPTEAGKYIARFTSTDTIFAKLTKEIPFTIERKQITVPILSENEFTYDGVTTFFSGLTDTDAYTVTDAGSKTAATVTVTLTLKSSNYVWIDGEGVTKTLTYKVKAAAVTLSGLTASNSTYGEEREAPTVITNIECTVVFKYSTTASGSYSETVPTAAGTYFVKAFVIGNENIIASESAPISFTIAKASASINNASDSYSAEYNSSAFDLSALGIKGSHEEGELEFSIMSGTEAVDSIVGAGTYTVTVTLESDNHETATVTFTVTVSKADNKDTLPTYNATYLDKLSSLTLPTSETGVWSWKNSDSAVGNAGTGKHVAVFTPYNSSNYNSREAEVTVIVAKRGITPPIGIGGVYTGEKIYSGLSSTANYTVSDEGGTDIGTYYATLTLTDSANYKWIGSDEATVSVSYVISKATNEWSTSPSVPDITFGEEVTSSGEAKFGGFEILYKPTGADDSEYTPTVPTNAGSYDVLFTSTSTNASVITAQITFTIDPAPAPLPMGGSSAKIYTGERIYSGFTDNEYFTVSDPGGINVGTYTYTFTLRSSNYVWEDGYENATRSFTFKINPATVTFSTFTVENWSYGESPKVVATANFGTAVFYYSTSETGTYTTTVPTEVGTYFVKAVIADTANYLGASIGPRSFKITKATPTVTAPTYADNVLYLNTVDISKDYKSAPSASVSGSFTYGSITFAHTESTFDLTFTPTDTAHYNTVTVKVAVALRTVAVIYDSSLTTEKSYHGTIESALRSAVSGDTVLVNPDATGKLYITENVTVPSGVMLVLPYGQHSTNLSEVYNQKNSAGHYEATVYGKKAEATPDACVTLVTVKAGVTVTNNGTVIIAGILSGGNAGASCGVTAGAHARLVLEENSSLLLGNGSKTDCLGYIVDSSSNGSGSVTVKNGATLIQPFVVFDFRGGSFMYAVYSKQSSYKYCPFSEYVMKNVESLMTIESGGLLQAALNLYAGDQQNATTANMVGNVASASLIQLTSAGGYVTSKYSPEDKKVDLDIFGGAQSGSMQLTVKALITVSIVTSDYFFPISYVYDISLNALPGESGATYTMSQSFVFRGGSHFTVSEGVTLNANEIAIWDEADIPALTYGARDYIDQGEAIFTVNGTLSVNKIAGKIRTEVDGATVTVKNSVALDTYHAYGSDAITGSSILASLNKVHKNSQAAMLVYGNSVYAKVGTAVSEGGKWPVVTTAITIGGDGFDFTISGNIYDADGNIIATGYDSRTDERRSEFFVDEGALVTFVNLPASKGVFINGSFINTAGAGNIYKGGDVEWIVSSGDSCEVKTIAVISSITNSASATVTVTYNSDGTITIAASKKGGAFATCSLKISASVSGKSDSDSKWSLTGYTAKVEITIPAGTLGETVTITT